MAVGGIGQNTDWRKALTDVRVVVHLAARVHQGPEVPGAARAYHETNTLGTRTLGEAAARSGIARFVYLSSVKAIGSASPVGHPWTEATVCHPVDAYGRSKRDAELALGEVAAESDLSVCVLRPPLVYGPGVRANLARLAEGGGRGAAAAAGRRGQSAQSDLRRQSGLSHRLRDPPPTRRRRIPGA